MTHVPDDLLQAFVDCEVDEQLAVHVAEHLDDCPACATRAAVLEPLGAAFAAADDPFVPDDLVQSVLAELRSPAPVVVAARSPLLEIGVGSGLIVMAASLVLLFGQPIQAAIRVGLALDALGTVASKVPLAGMVPMLLLAFTFFVLATTSVAAAQITHPARSLR